MPPHIEDTYQAIEDIGKFPVILGLVMMNIILVAALNALGVAITKYASAAQRSTVDCSRTALVWIIFMLAGKESWSWL